MMDTLPIPNYKAWKLESQGPIGAQWAEHQEGLNGAFWPKPLHRFDLQYHLSTSTLGFLQMHVVKWCPSQANN